MDQDVFWQVNSDEDHFADALFAFSPIGAQITPHQLVHALENHLFLSALHIEHAFVAQHLGAIDVDDGAQEIFQFGGVELALGLVDKAFHVVVMVVMVAWTMVMRM